jgi:hypothetical protein
MMPLDSLPEFDEVALLLRTAREHVEAGWCKGALYTLKRRSHCVLGAIIAANDYKETDLTYEAARRLAESLTARHHRKPTDDPAAEWTARDVLMRWNDVQSRTKKQVLEQLDKVLQPTN